MLDDLHLSHLSYKVELFTTIRKATIPWRARGQPAVGPSPIQPQVQMLGSMQEPAIPSVDQRPRQQQTAQFWPLSYQIETAIFAWTRGLPSCHD
jgi:hypothetical protein